MTNKKKKPMSASLKRFLKKYGRFPKKGELKRMNKRSHSPKKKKAHKKKHKSHQTPRGGARRSRSRGLVFG